MLAEPVVATFSDFAVLMIAGFIDHSSVDVPDLAPTETETRRLPPNPVPRRHRSCVSDTHCVLAHAVKPRATKLKSSGPKFEPLNVMLTDPDAWTFVCHA
jgi:hypothetical protein